MPITSILTLVLIVAMFLTFAGVLAYGEYQTRHIKRPSDAAKTPRANDEAVVWRKAA